MVWPAVADKNACGRLATKPSVLPVSVSNITGKLPTVSLIASPDSTASTEVHGFDTGLGAVTTGVLQLPTGFPMIPVFSNTG